MKTALVYWFINAIRNTLKVFAHTHTQTRSHICRFITMFGLGKENGVVRFEVEII